MSVNPDDQRRPVASLFAAACCGKRTINAVVVQRPLAGRKCARPAASRGYYCRPLHGSKFSRKWSLSIWQVLLPCSTASSETANYLMPPQNAKPTYSASRSEQAHQLRSFKRRLGATDSQRTFSFRTHDDELPSNYLTWANSIQPQLQQLRVLTKREASA